MDVRVQLFVRQGTLGRRANLDFHGSSNDNIYVLAVGASPFARVSFAVLGVSDAQDVWRRRRRSGWRF